MSAHSDAGTLSDEFSGSRLVPANRLEQSTGNDTIKAQSARGEADTSRMEQFIQCFLRALSVWPT
jgi:hypothetical protein